MAAVQDDGRPSRIERLRSDGPDTTRSIGAALATVLAAGDVIALSGELGAGKTCLVQGVAAGLGVTGRVTSPTFVLVRLHEGGLPLVHCDVYRLDNLADVHDLGDDVFAPDVVTCVEWGDAISALLPASHLEVELLRRDGADLGAAPGGAGFGAAPGGTDLGAAPGGTDDGRTIEVRAHGPRWQARGDALRAALAPWTDPETSR